MTAGTPYKKGKRKENRKDVRAAQVTVNKVSDASGTASGKLRSNNIVFSRL